MERCNYEYDDKIEPVIGFTKGIDWYFFREDNKKKKMEQCFLYCLEQYGTSNLNSKSLLYAVSEGFTAVLKVMKEHLIRMKKYEPLFLGERGMNLIQEAIASGYSDILHILSNGNSKMVIDDKGRTIEDYVNMKGSPICPTFAAKELG